MEPKYFSAKRGGGANVMEGRFYVTSSGKIIITVVIIMDFGFGGCKVPPIGRGWIGRLVCLGFFIW